MNKKPFKKEITSVAIDSEKLENLLLKTGKSIKEIGVELGHSREYLCNYIRRGYISQAAIKPLELIYGIKLEDYRREGYKCISPVGTGINERCHNLIVVKDEDYIKEESDTKDVEESTDIPIVQNVTIQMDSEELLKKVDDLGKAILLQNDILLKLVEAWNGPKKG